MKSPIFLTKHQFKDTNDIIDTYPTFANNPYSALDMSEDDEEDDDDDITTKSIELHQDDSEDNKSTANSPTVSEFIEQHFPGYSPNFRR